MHADDGKPRQTQTTEKGEQTIKFINWKAKNNIRSLYAAGWRTDNIAELVSEFYLSAEDAIYIYEQLANIEEAEQC